MTIEAVVLPLLAAALCDSEALHSWTSVAGSLSSLSLLHSNGFLHSQSNLLRYNIKISVDRFLPTSEKDLQAHLRAWFLSEKENQLIYLFNC